MSGIRRAITSLLCAVVATVLTPSAFVSADTPASGPSGVPSAGAGAPSAGAGAPGADDVSWAVQPSSEKGPNGRDNFTYSLKPGDSVTDYVGVSNFGKKPLQMKVYAMDAITTKDGAFTLPPAGVASEDVGSWVGLTGGGAYTIGPGQRLDIPFRLAVPTNAAPGDHAGGIVASLSEPVNSGEGAQQVAVDRRVGARIYVTVPGQRNPALQVSDVTLDYAGGWNPVSGNTVVSYTVRNTGNIRLGGKIDVNLSGIGGWQLGRAPQRAVRELLPGAEVTYTEEFSGIFPAFRLSAAVDVTPVSVGDAGDDVGAPVSGTGSTTALPWLLLAAALLVILIVVLLWLRGRRWRKRAKAVLAAAEGRAAAPVQAGSVARPDGHDHNESDAADDESS